VYNPPVADRLSKAKMEQLGKRLVTGDQPDADDLALLHQILLARSEQLEVAIARVRTELKLAPTSRVKNTGTILEKLRRQGGWTLASMQDIAGMRIVGPFDRRGQDEIVAQLAGLFGDGTSAPKVIDRREAPMHGYRAVHVVVFPAGSPIEIQVRTARQHEWAELFEKLADLVGRGIRYGEPPQSGLVEEELGGASAAIREVIRLRLELRRATVAQALALAEWLSAVEEGESTAPEDPELDAMRRSIDAEIAAFRESLADEL